MHELARSMPRPTAQVVPYVAALGADTAVTFLLTYGGAELYISDDPKGRSSHETLLGYDKAKALAAVAHQLPKRVPLAKKWLAQMLHWQGHSTGQIARTMRSSDVSVRKWLKPDEGKAG